MARSTVNRGTADLDEGENPAAAGRIRAGGGGRKKAEAADPELLGALESLIEPKTLGDPEWPLRWTTRSTRNLARELTETGHAVSHSVVAKILHSAGYSLQWTRKMLEGAQHPDRDGQFRHISSLAGEFLAAGDPVISVDTKKKELVGRFAQAGREYRRRLPGGLHASDDARDRARQVGIILRPRETWVRAHTRGVPEELEMRFRWHAPAELRPRTTPAARLG